VAVGPFEADGFGVGQFHRRRFDGHFENFFGHKIFSARGKVIEFLERRQDLSRGQNPLEVIRSSVIVST
jgi:hypothetical protein